MLLIFKKSDEAMFGKTWIAMIAFATGKFKDGLLAQMLQRDLFR